ncbi:hypothetical protein NQZ68_026352 [Dissostichus eleginoides]|nr:hypothetical protein NQZ68_026352 [Dissostichus eleginoides]
MLTRKADFIKHRALCKAKHSAITPIIPDPATPIIPDPSTPIIPDPSTPIIPDPSIPIIPDPSTPIIPEGKMQRVNLELAWRSGIKAYQCTHLKSITYGSSYASPTELDEETLTEMVNNKWFGEDKETLPGSAKPCQM